MSLPSFSSSSPPPEAGAATRPGNAGQHPRRRDRRPLRVSPRSRTRPTGPAPRPRPGRSAGILYVITAGSTGGVIMHLADQATAAGAAAEGLGPAARTTSARRAHAAGEQDREIVSFDGRVLITRFIDPGRRHPLRQHGLRPLRAKGVSFVMPGLNGGHASPPASAFSWWWIARRHEELPNRPGDDSGGMVPKQKTPALARRFVFPCPDHRRRCRPARRGRRRRARLGPLRSRSSPTRVSAGWRVRGP